MPTKRQESKYSYQTNKLDAVDFRIEEKPCLDGTWYPEKALQLERSWRHKLRYLSFYSSNNYFLLIADFISRSTHVFFYFPDRFPIYIHNQRLINNFDVGNLTSTLHLLNHSLHGDGTLFSTRVRTPLNSDVYPP